MMILKTIPQHKTTRIKRRFAWLPVTVRCSRGRGCRFWRVSNVTGDKERQLVIWLEYYKSKEVYYAHGESSTGYDYIPQGWHIISRFDLRSQQN